MRRALVPRFTRQMGLLTADPGSPVVHVDSPAQSHRSCSARWISSGFRSTFSDWCAEQTSFPSEVREMALAHAVGDKVEAACRRGDLFQKRRELAEAWAHYCDGEEPAESKVVWLAGRAG
jgi:hypothetical protein